MSALKRYFFIPMMWLTMAAVVGFTSLLSAHLHQTQAATFSPSPQPKNDSFSARPILDPRHPGTLPYMALRAQDRVQQALLRPDEHAVVYLKRAHQRLETAQYAWQQGDQERAVSALYKSHGYASRSLQACHTHFAECESLTPEYQEYAQEIQESIQEFQPQCQDEKCNSVLAKLSDNVSALGFSQ